MWKSQFHLNQLYRSCSNDKFEQSFEQLLKDEELYEFLKILRDPVPETELQRVHKILLMNSKEFQHIVGDVAKKMKAFFSEKTWQSYQNLYDILPPSVQSHFDLSLRILAEESKRV